MGEKAPDSPLEGGALVLRLVLSSPFQMSPGTMKILYEFHWRYWVQFHGCYWFMIWQFSPENPGLVRAQLRWPIVYPSPFLSRD